MTIRIGSAVDSAASPTGLLRGAGPVTDGTSIYSDGLSDGSAQGQTYKSTHRMLETAHGLQLVYGNFYDGNTDGNASITVTASVECSAAYPSGAVSVGRTPVYFDGDRSVTIPAGSGLKVSDPLEIDFNADVSISVYTYVHVGSAGEKWPMGTMSGTKNGADTDHTLAGGTFSAATSGYRPLVIAAQTADRTRPGVLLVGDSLFGGTDNWALRTIKARSTDTIATVRGVPVRLSKAGEGHDGYVFSGNSRYRIPLWEGSTHAFQGNGLNDFFRGLARVQLDWIMLCRMLAWRGKLVLAQTYGPHSGDSAGTITARTDFNTWIRDGAPLNASTFAAVAAGGSGIRMGETGHPVHSYVDIAAVTETSAGSNTFNTGMSDDGTHPNTTGIAAIAADSAVDAAVVSWLAASPS